MNVFKCLGLAAILYILVTSSTHAAAPVVFWASDPVRPGEVVVVQGGRFGRQPKLELTWSEEAKPRDSRTIEPLQASDDSLKFLVPTSWKQGIYRFVVQADGEKSATVALNVPDIWWQQGDWGREASPGGWLRIFGKCLSFEDRASVLLRTGGKDSILKPRQQDLWSLNVELPASLAPGDYDVFVHNGYDGQAGWQAAGKIRIGPHSPVWKADTFDAAKFGAVANDGMDDTFALQKALDAAEANGGGIVTLPRGRFQMNDPLRIPRRVLLKGAGMKLTEIYWRDTPEPMETLILGTNSFGIEDLTIMAANHRYGILADDGDKPEAGNVTLRRLHVHLNRFEQLQAEQAAKRVLPMPWEHAICLGGENVQVTDCEVFSSRSPFGFKALRHAVVRNNRFFEGDVSHMFSGEAIIIEDNEIEGGPTGRGGADYGAKLYFARNKVGMMPLADGEGFTTDGGGNAPVALVSGEGTRLTLGTDVDWNRWTRKGTCPACICIMEGTGAGQCRKVASHQGRQVELQQPWLLPPDATSVLHVIPYSFQQNLIIGNQFHDVTVVQSYAWAIDWIFAGNRLTRAGGIRAVTHRGDPAWYVQYLENEIEVGSGYRGPVNSQPPDDSVIAVQSGNARCHVLRRNVLHNNARIMVHGSARDVLIERNTILDADVGINAGRSVSTLLWGNRFERVKEPLVGMTDKVAMQPADRVLGELSAVKDSLPPGSDETLARLAKLATEDPLKPGLADEVRACLLPWVQRLAALPRQELPPEVLAALWGVRLVPSVSDKFRPLLDGQGGSARLWLSLAPAACTLPARLTLEFPTAPGCRVETLKDLKLTPGTEKGHNVDVTVEPGIVGPFTVPVRWTVEGEGWRVGGQGRFKIGDDFCGKIVEWAICGPFTNAARNALDESVIHGPERRLDLAAQYDTPEGKRGWKTVKAANVDFIEQFGQPKSAVAYAVAVLRAKKPTPVLVEFTVPGHGILEPSLNSQPWRVPNHYGRRFSRTLQKGDNVLMVKLASTEKAWNLQARLRMVDGAAPGDVAVVPMESLASVAVLHPMPKPPIPEGTSLPHSDGVDWRLVYEDDFDRNRLGADWVFRPTFWAEGPFEFGHGVLTSRPEMYSFLSFARPVTLPLRVEYDVKGTGGCVSTVTLTPAKEVGLCGGGHVSGYALTCSRGGHGILRDGQKVATSKGVPGAVPDQWHHVVVQFVPPKVTMLVDGKLAAEYRDDHYLPNLDTFTLGGDAWSLPQYDNVRIYAPPRKVGP